MQALSTLAIFSSFFFLSACTSTPQAQEPLIKKSIKDVNYQARKEDSSPRKRLMVLPFLDTDTARTQALRDAAREEFISDLNKTGEVIAVDSKDLKVDFTKNIANGEYQLSEIAKAAKDLGVSALLEGKVIDLSVRGKGDKVGVFRQLKTIFEAQVRVRISSAKSGAILFNTVKTVTVEESNVRVAESVNSDRFSKIILSSWRIW